MVSQSLQKNFVFQISPPFEVGYSSWFVIYWITALLTKLWKGMRRRENAHPPQHEFLT